jgi:hypothetical protein
MRDAAVPGNGCSFPSRVWQQARCVVRRSASLVIGGKQNGNASRFRGEVSYRLNKNPDADASRERWNSSLRAHRSNSAIVPAAPGLLRRFALRGDANTKGVSKMKNKRSTNRSFPGRLTLEGWIALPDIGRRDMIHRAECELLECHRLCASKQCQRHRTCCADDSTGCQRGLWQRARSNSTPSLRRELSRLKDLARLLGPRRKTSKNTSKRAFWTAGMDDPWNAPAKPPWGPAAAPGTSSVQVPGGEVALNPTVWSIIQLRQPGNFGGEGG